MYSTIIHVCEDKDGECRNAVFRISSEDPVPPRAVKEIVMAKLHSLGWSPGTVKATVVEFDNDEEQEKASELLYSLFGVVPDKLILGAIRKYANTQEKTIH